ncbi:MAG: hypothetical protein JWM96_1323 [Alphaproteobacteria bacterium]|nr:hypothetical protein [Alphaproteobacteria bacterium]
MTATSTERWIRVKPGNPCQICKHDGFCEVSPDGAIAGCMRVSDGAFKTVPTALGDKYLHDLTGVPRERPAPRPKPSASARDVMADRAVFSIVMRACATLSELATNELVRRFGTINAPQIIERFRIGYCDGPALLQALDAAGRRQDAIAAGVLRRDGTVPRSLLGHLLIPYIRDGLVHDIRIAGIKGIHEATKEISLPGSYADRDIADLFHNHDALKDIGEDGTIHICGGAYKTMALAQAGLLVVGLRGEAELSEGHIAALQAAGVRTIILHIDAEDPKEGQPLSAGRRLGLTKAERLATAGFVVRVAEPPHEPGTAKVDGDSLLRDLGPRAVRDYAYSAIALEAWRVVIGVESPGAPPEIVGRMERMEQENRNLRALQVASAHLDRNKNFKAQKPTIKAVVYEYASKLSRNEIDANGWMRTTRAALAELSGGSDDTVGDHLEEVSQWGVGIHKDVRYEEHRRVDDDGQVAVERRRVLLLKVDGRPAEVLMALGGDYAPPRAINKVTGKEKDTWGGKRTPCPRCQSLRRLKIEACADCGHEFSRTVEEPPADTPLPSRDASINAADLRVEQEPDEPDAHVPSVPPTPI